jgi:UDP-N-acetylmuramoyl-L-alanyl-D-glutamate--2,6-diaminopimelate ligase
MIGLTATKGKTTTSFMIKKILENNEKKVGMIGTIGAFIGDEKIETHNTTPESYELYHIFSQMVESGCTHCVMEVSSQGLKQNRVEGIQFQIGIFTNFSEDHIGPTEHASMDEYLYCKSLLFQKCEVGIINVDDPAYKELLMDATCEVFTFGKTKTADIHFKNPKLLMREDILGASYDTEGKVKAHIELGMPGIFNIYNSLAAIALSYQLKLDMKKTYSALYGVSVRGRVETVPISKDYHVIIDYAHNEEEVKSLLTMIKEYRPKRLVCIYGGGGNRAKARRYSMGELCGSMAELSILCCDNPREEEVSDINKDIIVGIQRSNGKYIEIEDRKEAIIYCLDHAKKGDLILLLGKGHEEYQEIKGKKYYFSEREVLEEYRREKFGK